ncbi:inositol monophosphatase family protein [Herbiconiux ginsengi]|uniref:Histidinol-phosphatase n=1 Tax=Herbiconiux ginsengi TaxID=381665 RepID=A0A1H3Q788_9MICO|nr:inositol monophosphatase family protein [Herbiconiux ginsengi]SDZ08569.1 histidinol-phosphate phosphatase [Herbiconiux ginsengi]
MTSNAPAAPPVSASPADLALALRLADLADAISRERFRATDLTVVTKPDRTPVTDADRAVEQAIRTELTAQRPGDSIFGEEFGTAGESSRQWILDPIDGTANFMRGVPVWATLISLAVDGVPVVGVVSSPALGRRWWGATGLGAYTTDALDDRTGAPRPIHVSGIGRLADASLSYNSFKGWDEEGRLDQLTALARAVWRTRAYGEMWSYMMVAEGQLEIAAEFDLKPYDMAALVPIVQEAGGRFSSADGEDGPWGGSALATNGLLHDDVIALISGRRASN